MSPYVIAPTGQGLYCWGGQFYSVPEEYFFPKKMLLKQAWTRWVMEKSANRMESSSSSDILECLIKPFRSIDRTTLPTKLRNTFCNDIQPILKLMSTAPDINFLDVSAAVDAAFIERSFLIGLAHVKTLVEYIFVTDKWKKWSVLYMCKKVTYSMVMKHGTNSDKICAATNKGFRSAPRRQQHSYAVHFQGSIVQNPQQYGPNREQVRETSAVWTEFSPALKKYDSNVSTFKGQCLGTLNSMDPTGNGFRKPQKYGRNPAQAPQIINQMCKMLLKGRTHTISCAICLDALHPAAYDGG